MLASRPLARLLWSSAVPMLSVTIAVAIGSAGSWPSVASAQAARATTSAHDRAVVLFEQSVAAYRAGRFGDAATLVREAYALEPAPVLLYNLARALDADGQLVEARDAYRRYLAEEPEADQRASCERRIEVLSAQIDANATELQAPAMEGPPPVATASDTVPVRTPSGPDLVPPLLVLGLGAAVTIAGGLLVGVGSERHDAAVLEPVSLRAAEIEAEALGLRDAGVGLLAVGSVAVLSGAVWATVASLASSNGEVEARIGPTGASIRGRF